MADDKDFQVKVQRIGELVGELENIADPESRASAKALVQLLLDLHAAGLERVMEIVAKNGDSGQRTIDDLGRDPLVSSLSGSVRPSSAGFGKPRGAGGGESSAASAQGRRRIGICSALRMASSGCSLQVDGHACGSTGKTLKKLVEDALYEAAPDMSRLSIEGLEEAGGSSGFVPAGQAGRSDRSRFSRTNSWSRLDRRHS